MSRRVGRPRSLRFQSWYFALLAAAAAAFSVYGPATGRPAMAAIGLPLAVFFTWGSWMISPAHVRRWQPGRLSRLLDRFFDRLGIEWLTGPKSRNDSADPLDRDV